MIENEFIKSIKSYNGHILLTVYPQFTMKLSRFSFKLEENEYCDAFYNSKGYLELYSLEAAEKFLGCNEIHLSEKLRTSILDDAKNHFQNPMEKNVVNNRLSFFHQTEEKIPVHKLENLQVWLKNYCNRQVVPNIRDSFDKVFLILFPRDKRQKNPTDPFYQVFESEGTIEIESVKSVIGKAYSNYSLYSTKFSYEASC